MAGQRIFRLMDETGDGTGNIDFNKDYSNSGLGIVLAKITDAKPFRLHRVMTIIVDDGATAWDSGRFSASRASLTRWLGFSRATSPAGIPNFFLTPEQTPKTQGDFRRSGWKRTRTPFTGGTNREIVTMEFNMWEPDEHGNLQPLLIPPGNMLQAFINDDMSTLTRLQFLTEISFE